MPCLRRRACVCAIIFFACVCPLAVECNQPKWASSVFTKQAEKTRNLTIVVSVRFQRRRPCIVHGAVDVCCGYTITTVVRRTVTVVGIVRGYDRAVDLA